MKKLSSLFLILLLLNLQWGNISVYGAANSETDFVTETNATGVTITDYNGITTDVIIPATIKGQDVTSIRDSAFFNNQLTSVIIPENVTYIGNYAFDKNKLKNVTIPQSVTVIGGLAFSNNQLTSVTIPPNVSIIGFAAFANNQLTSVTIPKGNAIVGDEVFANNQLTSVTIPTDMTVIPSRTFANNQLTSVTIPAGVTYIGNGAFENNQLNQVEFNGQVSNIGKDVFSYQVKRGNTFSGWFENSSYTRPWTNTVPSPMTIYAKWNLVPTGIVLSPKTGQLTVGDTQNYQLVENYIDGSSQDQTANTTFAVSDSTIAIMQNNVLTAIAPGIVTVTATYGTTYDTATITVNAPPVTTTGTVLSPKTGQLTVGSTQSFQLIENFSTGTSEDRTANTTFTVSNPTIATMLGNELTAIAPGTVTVTGTYGSTSDTAMITVNAPPVTTTGIVLSPKTGQLTVRGTQSFQLVENFSDGTSEDRTANTTFKVSNPTIATMQGNELTAIAPGTVTVTGTYGSTSNTATITVNAPPEPTPVPQPVEPTPSHAIDIIRTVEQGIVKYRADVLLENVQAQVQQMANKDARTIRLVYPAETATAEAYLNLSRNAGLFLNNQHTNFFMHTALAQLMMPSTSFDGVKEDVFYRIVPVKAQQETIHTNALKNEQIQQAMPNRAVISIMGTPVTIETNMQNRPVTVTLPIPVETTEEQMASLVVYIEHSDGTTEVKRGRIVEFEPGVKGFQFEVEHFSTFSLVYASEVKRFAPYIQGYPDGTFKPNASVTRAQMATMLARFLTNGDIPTTTNSSFEDTTNHPSKDAIEVVMQVGLFNDTTKTTFHPNGTITRAQMASVVAHWIETECAQDPLKIICHASGKGKSYTDVSSNHWAARAIEQVSTWGIMTGNSETTFNPNVSLTRAQAVKVLNQLFERPALEDITMSTFSDVPSTHWAKREIEEAATERIVKK
ncbi:leucine-rich repeat protein [Psychrobacillus sp. INOP01]|uniref:leucine-rich repeat protein n=1 Tax=Psychrobacillus sp. INOP01 TaxID=2829187 RepID=UPI001BACD43E|nr:leucine-rich repeat protein [Psychrobacillus sp. INOP01]QUG41217.1 leucine-rich repeat protein [Psychrobacillus sp. INOP01]